MVKWGPQALDKVGFANLAKAEALAASAPIPILKMQKKWKHAPQLGINDAWKAKDTLLHQKFSDAVNAIIAKPDKVFVAPYHDVPFAVHFFQGNKLVLTEVNGEFISAWDNIASKLGGIEGSAPPSASAKNFRVK